MTARAWVIAAVLGATVSAPAAAQDPTTPQAPTRRISSWTSDDPLLSVGDIVTILVDEYTIALASRDEFHSNGRDTDIGAGANLPISVGGRSGMAGSYGSTVGAEERRFGESARRDRFQAEISARVVEITGNTVRLEGTKRLMIDDHEQEVVIRGWVRSQDVATDNTVASWLLADAEIAYDSNGDLGNAGSFWSKLLKWIIP